ncbi:hypothetical protein [Rhodopirellula sallentina]|nr:hypothetical protein [Rhodopirellula sallentina]
MVVLGLIMLATGGGCALVPETRTRDTLHNPFPQLKRVAVLPFFNQSDQPNVDGEAVGRAYYAALQAVPGFEVLPVGVTALQYRAFSAQFGEPRSGEDFQKLAQMMDVEAIVVGSVTDFDAYYPPRMGLTVHWYAANEGFHAIPPGYGLPWGTESEDKIPARIAREAEFELARSQLKTQEPRPAPLASMPTVTGAQPGSPNHIPSAADRPPADRNPAEHAPTESDPWGEPVARSRISRTQFTENVTEQQIMLSSPGQPAQSPAGLPNGHAGPHAEFEYAETGSLDGIVSGPVYADDCLVEDGGWVNGQIDASSTLPANWPEPTDLIPDPPQPVAPMMVRQHEPVLSHTRLYRGDDPYFTARLADYVETGDDARGMSWQGYIKRSEDFIRFCCHLHIVEMLESRGGQDPSDLILRWPVSRY